MCPINSNYDSLFTDECKSKGKDNIPNVTETITWDML